MTPQEALYTKSLNSFIDPAMIGAVVAGVFSNIGQGKQKIAKATAEQMKADTLLKAQTAQSTPQKIQIIVILILILVAAFILIKK